MQVYVLGEPLINSLHEIGFNKYPKITERISHTFLPWWFGTDQKEITNAHKKPEVINPLSLLLQHVTLYSAEAVREINRD